MTVILGHTTALRWWRDGHELFNVSAVPASSNFEAMPSMLELKALPANLRPSGDSECHIVAMSPKTRTRVRGFKSHVWPLGAEDALYRDVAPGVYAVSPELLFLQMASDLPFSKLVLLGCELCGNYSLSNDPHEPFMKRDPLTSVDELRTYLVRNPHRRGAKVALSAVDYVLDNSRSPMESILALLCSMPKRLGGCGYKGLELNVNLDVPDGISKAGLGRSFEMDLFWPEKNVCVEYDSTAFHQALDKQALDARRRTVLRAMEIQVIDFTSPLVRNLDQFQVASKALGKALGADTRMRGKALYAQRQLHEELLSDVAKWTRCRTPGRSTFGAG